DEDEDEEDEDGDGDGESPRRRKAGRGMSASAAAEAGLRHLAELTTKQPIGVTSIESSEEGWLVGIEVVEDRRVPSSADVLAIYEAQVDDSGDLVAYRRVKRYSRGQGDGG
ncbi:MAG: gas vesicle protein, partial [Acidimicrobiales bacterium]|nr:gas vesicle protein [Acidimicrobiales bacterium]